MSTEDNSAGLIGLLQPAFSFRSFLKELRPASPAA